VAAQAAALPIILFHMNEINIAGFLSNLIIIPLTGLILSISILAGVLYPLQGYFALKAAAGAEVLFSLKFKVLGLFSGLGLHFVINDPGPALIIAFILLVAPLVPLLNKKRIMPLSIIASLVLVFASYSSEKNGEKKIFVIDHDRGRAYFIKNGEAITAAGFMPDSGRSQKLFDAMGINSLSDVTMFINDTDPVNIARSTSMIKALNVSRCFLTPDFRFNTRTKKLFEVIDIDEIPLIITDMKSGKGDISTGEDRGVRDRYPAGSLFQKIISIPRGIRKKNIDSYPVEYLMI